MIIPIRCTNCGKLIGDKYTYYVDQLRIIKGTSSLEPIYFDGKKMIVTEEKKLCNKLGFTRYCCVKTITSHTDLIKKV
jgi:DNA-directed RNA polymerase subunit N (RpoN/RPB10)